MASILLKNNLLKMKSSTMLREHGKQFTILDPLRVNEKFNIIKNIKRQTGNTGVSIKQYQSNRKYVGLWKLERSAGIALAFMVPLGFCIESKEYEMVASCIATLHSYWGCESMCKDYVRSPVVGNTLPVIARCLNITLSLVTLMGMYHLIYKDCGIVNTVKKLWTIRGHKLQIQVQK